MNDTVEFKEPKHVRRLLIKRRNWADHWRLLRVAFPITCVFCVLAAESVLVDLWLDHKKISASLPGILLLVACVFTLPNLAIPLDDLARRWGESYRVALSERGVEFGEGKPLIARPVPWAKVLGMSLEPVNGIPDALRLSIFYRDKRKADATRRWTMGLTISQASGISSALDQFHQSNKFLSAQPTLPPQPSPQAAAKGIWCLMLSFFLACHGLPIFMAAFWIASSDPSEHDTPPDSLIRVLRYVFQTFHMHSARDLRWFVGMAGGLLLVGAFGLWRRSLFYLPKSSEPPLRSALQ